MKSNGRKTTTRIAALTIAIAIGVIGCGTGAGNDPATTADGGDGGDGERIVLELPNFQFDETPFSDWWQELEAKFEKEHPNVDVQQSDAGRSSQYADVLQTRFAAGDPPELIHELQAQFARFADPGYLMGLEDVIEGTNVLTQWSPLQAGFEWAGSPRGVLLPTSYTTIYYNKQLLADAGITEPPSTPEELLAAAQAVYDPAAGIYGHVAPTAPQDPHLFGEATYFVLGHGGKWYNDDTPTATDPKVVAGIDFYRELVKTGPAGLTQNQRNQLFFDGRAAFMLMDFWFAAALEKEAKPEVFENVEILRPFLPVKVQPGIPNSFIGLPAGLEGEKLAAATEFIRMAASPEMQEAWVRLIGVPAADLTITSEERESTSRTLPVFRELIADYPVVDYFPDSEAVRARLAEVVAVVDDAITNMTGSQTDTATLMGELQTNLERVSP
jgi:multiple sugar transport system substrate-binding protein